MTGPSRRPTEVAAPGRLPTPVRRRRPLLAAVAVLLGLLVWLVVSSGLQRASERVQVWSLASDVARGQTVEAGQLVPTEIAVTSTAGLVEVADMRASQLAGGLWAADLTAGTLVAPSLILERLSVDADEALVGLALPPGGWPSPALRAGDTVMVLHTGGDGPAVLVEAATVEAVTVLGDAAAAIRLVTVAVPRTSAAAVAAADAAGQVTLVVVP